MKKTLLIIPLLIFSTTLLFPQSKVNINNLSDYGGKMFNENDDKPYTGLVFDLYRTTGNKSLEGRYKDGLRNGKWSWWSEDGKMDSSGTYKDGNQDRKWTSWYENGQKEYEGTYKDGKREGLSTWWRGDGQKRLERTFKVGKQDGLLIEWYENGQKEVEGNFEDGKQDGLWTYYRKDGSNETEGYFENGVKTHKWWYWDENGKYYYVIRIVLESDIIPLLRELASKRDDQLEGVLNNIAQEYLYKDPNSSIFTVFEKEVSIRNIKLSQYYHQYGASVDEIMTALKIEVDNAINRIVEILQNRLDQFGVAEQTIQKQGSHRIIVELAGAQDAKRTRFLLESTGLLEFILIKSPELTNDMLLRIDKVIKGSDELADLTQETDTKNIEDTPVPVSEDKTISVRDLFTDQALVDTTDEAVVVDLNLVEDRPFSSLLRALGNDIGVPEKNIYIVKKILAMEDVQFKLDAANGQFLLSDAPESFSNIDGGTEKMYRMFYLEGEPELTGGVVEKASATIGGTGSSASGQSIVLLDMNSEGAKTWSRVTGGNIGRRVGIVLDKKVHMAPVIRSKISDGGTMIEGFANMDEAKDIAIVLRAGALPVPVDIIEERLFVKKYVE
jgi:protein-export membrane protein SecD